MKDSQIKRGLDALADLLLTGPAPVELTVRKPEPDDDDFAHLAPPPPRPRPAALDDEATRLRLAGDEAAAPLVEAILLGHLPGYASPWISQYAHAVAQEHGSAAVVRIEGNEARVEVFDASLTPGPAAGPDDDEPLITALCRLAPTVGAWLIVADPPDAPVSRRRLAELDRWTILTGADEAAVIAAYRLLKTVVERPDSRAPQRGVGFMFMGSGDDEAAAAMGRIRRATEKFLQVPVELTGVRKQMAPARRSYAGEFPADNDTWSTLVEFLHDLTAAASDDLEADDDLPSLHLTDAPSAGAGDLQVPGGDPRPPAPAPNITAPQLLSSYVKLTPMTARNPRHEEVELATDDAGNLHLLMQANAADVDAALRTLDETRRWAAEHRQLIALTEPARKLTDAQPVTHLFTDEPARAASYAFAAAESPAKRALKLHLLKPVIVNGTGVHIHAEIS